ncbi:MAG: sigma-54-dependent Fis family transcriptional regulator [Sedimentisphaerales bacterium]|nr:sigma-54-dependent Fis family transcriptional regulator [Sedimentisphaerales bacterium]
MSQKAGIILVVDDEREHADGVAEALEKLCDKAIAVYNGKDALEILHSQTIDIVVTDLKLNSEIDGLQILTEAKKHDSRTEVILITAYATIDTCKEAIKLGAFDYLVKPIDIGQLRTLVTQASQKIDSSQGRDAGKRKPDKEDFYFEGVLPQSPAMKGIVEVLRRVSPTNISVLIEGQSGTGKELMARAIHNNSKRWNKPFRPVNCAGLTETLLESELFGHTKGAFTGAAVDRKGLFEVANQGTLFLDEIGDMTPNSQAKLLRVLEDGIVVPVGSTKPINVDVRIISATNQNLSELIDEKKFREDLYFRIKGVNISLPSLRERSEDIPPLVDFFLKEAAEEVGSKVTGITPVALSTLLKYDWPGNIRQLRNSIRTMVVMCDRDKIDVIDIPPDIAKRPQLAAPRDVSSMLGDDSMSLNELEKHAIAETLAKTDGNREKAAKMLGIGERTLYRKIKDYNL